MGAVTSQGTPLLTIVLPAYDEKDTIESAVAAVASRVAAEGLACEILVVDDGSRDGTAAAALEAARRLDAEGRAAGRTASASVRVISYKPNRGKGHAVRTGILEARGRFVMFMDVDLSTPPSYIPAFLAEAAAGRDVVVASRRLPGSKTSPPQGALRRLAGRVFTRLSCVSLGLPPGTTDVTCGFKMFRGSVARTLFARQRLEGWGFDAETLYLASRRGLSIRELPVTWSHRSASRVRVFRDAVRTLFELLEIRRHAAAGGYRDPDEPAGTASPPRPPDEGSPSEGGAGGLHHASQAGSGVGGGGPHYLLGRA